MIAGFEKNLEDSSAQVLMSLQMGARSLITLPTSPAFSQRKRKNNNFSYNDDYIAQNCTHISSKRSAQNNDNPLELEEKPIVGPNVHNMHSPSDVGTTLIPVYVQQVKIEEAKRVGDRLRNLLKLPKAHQRCIFEWFYSHIDNALLKGENDFSTCLKESFPELSVRKLTRCHWSKLRRLMGKPRRCSQAFFEEEILALENKRNKIRLLQQRRMACNDPGDWNDLPREIPMPLVIGTDVTVRIRASHDGLLTGRIDAVDICNASYRVTFDQSNIGTHLVPDFEVASCEPQETISLLSLIEQKRYLATSNRLFSNISDSCHKKLNVSYESSVNNFDPILGQSPVRSRFLSSPSNEYGGMLGGFPLQLLKQIVCLSKVLSKKRKKIQKLSEMNLQAEKANSYAESLSLEFLQKYAKVVLYLERLNKDLNGLLVEVQRFCLALYPEQTLPCNQSAQRKKQCLVASKQIVTEKNNENNTTGFLLQKMVKNNDLVELVTQLTALMMQIKCLTDSNENSIEYHSLSDAMKDIKMNLSTENQECFQNNVEIHMAYIRSGMELCGVNDTDNSSNASNM